MLSLLHVHSDIWSVFAIDWGCKLLCAVGHSIILFCNFVDALSRHAFGMNSTQRVLSLCLEPNAAIPVNLIVNTDPCCMVGGSARRI